MKITGVRQVFNAENHYVIIETYEWISGLGEYTLNTRQLAVAGALTHLEPVLTGQDPMRAEHIWQDIFRGTFWRGGSVLLSALHCDLAIPNFCAQEAGLFSGGQEHLAYDAELKDGWYYLGATPGLGGTLREDKVKPFVMREYPH